MRNGIYEITGHKLVRDDKFIEVRVCKVSGAKDGTIAIPYTAKDENDIKNNRYLVYYKPRGGVAYELCKTFADADKSLSIMMSYYAAGISS